MALAWFNHQLYGSPWRMGYLSIFSAFSWSYFNQTMVHFAHWLAVLLPAVLLVLPFALARRTLGRMRELTALALWFFIPVLVYACYDISHQVWWCLRFILPAVPALIFAALLGLDVLLEKRPRTLAAAQLSSDSGPRPLRGIGRFTLTHSWSPPMSAPTSR